jgi:hypothetical protein
MSSIFEVLMLLCFAVSWPFNIRATYKARTARFKSVMFEVIVEIGYVFGMLNKVVNDSVINLSLPTAQILDIITNPSDIRTFSEKGNWSHERVTITKNAARAKLLELVMEENMLATAEENGKRQLSAIFSSFGFKHVNIAFVVDSTVCDSLSIVGDSVSKNATTLFAN